MYFTKTKLEIDAKKNPFILKVSITLMYNKAPSHAESKTDNSTTRFVSRIFNLMLWPSYSPERNQLEKFVDKRKDKLYGIYHAF